MVNGNAPIGKMLGRFGDAKIANASVCASTEFRALFFRKFITVKALFISTNS